MRWSSLEILTAFRSAQDANSLRGAEGVPLLLKVIQVICTQQTLNAGKKLRKGDFVEKGCVMELLELMKHRRSIRKYEQKQIPLDDLQKIIDAGLYAPSAGGGQRVFICALHNSELCEKIGRLNMAYFSRDNLIGTYVSKEQPSVIDDVTIKSGFYGAPTVCVICTPLHFEFAVADAFCAAENMVLEATELGIASCIVSRAEETFMSSEGRAFLEEWGVPDGFVARAFVTLGYCKGDYPKVRERKSGRFVIVD